MSPVRIVAPAKLNLFLHITGRRDDGYHLLESLVAFTAFGDMLEFSPDHTFSLNVTGPFSDGLAAGDGNLVMKAAQALARHAGGGRGAAITLHKHIPVGAGLGGGSSDAAATLLGLARLWELPVSAPDLHSMASSLGSDVPVCLVPKAAAWVTGVGEQVTPVPFFSGVSVLLAGLRTPLLTRDVYLGFSGAFAAPVTPPAALRSLDALIRFITPLGNALEAPATALQPQIGGILAALRAAEGCLLARMSGSGSTCFALFQDVPAARQAAHGLRRAHPEWWVQESVLQEG